MATPILMPRQGQSVESCILVEWKVKPGDTVKTGDIVASIETDKATFDVEAPADGAMVELFFEDGDDIPVLTHIAAIGEPGEDVSALRPTGEVAAESVAVPETAPVPATPPSSPSEPATTGGAVSAVASTSATAASPRARKRAAEKGVDAFQLAETGPRGRVIERDVLAAASAQGHLSAAARAALQPGVQVPAVGSGPGGMVLTADLRASAGTAAPVEVPVKGIRKVIAERMVKSLTSTAQLTLQRSFDATALQQVRAKVKAHGEAFGVPPLTVNDLIVYATVRTLLKHPELNAHFLGSKIVRFPYVNVGIAVDSPRGLMVPVVHHAEQMTLPTLAQTIRPLAKACVEGQAKPEQLSGGTFTITNLGALGIDLFTPVLNAPEVAILGVGGLFLKPVQGPRGVEHVQAMNLSLTIDHQAVDGAPGARFLQDLTLALENIELLMSEEVSR